MYHFQNEIIYQEYVFIVLSQKTMYTTTTLINLIGS